MKLEKIPFNDVYNQKIVHCKDPEQVKFRLGMYAVVTNAKDEVLLIRDGRCKHVQWELPGGGMEIGEEPQETLVREVKEETGYDVECSQLLLVNTSYVYQKNKDQFYQCINMIFLANLLSDEPGETNYVTENEIVDMKWVAMEELKKLPLAEMHKGILKLL